MCDDVAIEEVEGSEREHGFLLVDDADLKVCVKVQRRVGTWARRAEQFPEASDENSQRRAAEEEVRKQKKITKDIFQEESLESQSMLMVTKH